MSTLQSELDGGPVGGLSEHPDGELEAMRGALLQPEGEVGVAGLQGVPSAPVLLLGPHGAGKGRPSSEGGLVLLYILCNVNLLMWDIGY